MITPRTILLVAIVAAFATFDSAKATTVYSYTGLPFSLGVSGTPPPGLPYTTSMYITGEISFDNPLPANFATSDASTIPGFAFEFSDGVQNYSFNWPGGGGGGWRDPQIYTDDSGNIIGWFFSCSNVNGINGIVNGMKTTADGDVGYIGTGAPIVQPVAYSAGPGLWEVVDVPEPSNSQLTTVIVTSVLANLYMRCERKRKTFVI